MDVNEAMRLARRPRTAPTNWDDLRDAVSVLAAEVERLREELDAVADMVDDILYDPHFHPVTAQGKPITGNDFYLTDHPVMDDHVPALRQWFVKHCNEAAKGGE